MHKPTHLVGQLWFMGQAHWLTSRDFMRAVPCPTCCLACVVSDDRGKHSCTDQHAAVQLQGDGRRAAQQDVSAPAQSSGILDVRSAAFEDVSPAAGRDGGLPEVRGG